MSAEGFAGRRGVCKRGLGRRGEEPAPGAPADKTLGSKSRSGTFVWDRRRRLVLVRGGTGPRREKNGPVIKWTSLLRPEKNPSFH